MKLLSLLWLIVFFLGLHFLKELVLVHFFYIVKYLYKGKIQNKINLKGIYAINITINEFNQIKKLKGFRI